jgi:ABC-2 type transport system ATP-binding protein
VIEARDLTKRYGSTVVVDHLSFDVHPGRVTGFLGPNGAGKSTTMRMILGLDTPSAGRALVAGRPYRSLDTPLRVVGSLLDPAGLHGGRSAGNHLRWLAASNGLPRERVSEVLHRTGLAGVARRRVGGFSLGMRQRLGIAAALLGDPRILLLDEPVNGLDPEGIRWIRTLLRSLAAEGRTVFISSHLMSEMALTADHLIVVGGGRLLADTSMTDFIGACAAADAVVRTPDGAVLAGLLRAAGATVTPGPDELFTVSGLAVEGISRIAADHGVRVYELTARQASLEEAYLAMTGHAVEFGASPLGTAPSPASGGSTR